jgi:hypothetical protein
MVAGRTAEPKKSLDATTATAGTPAVATDAAVVEEEKKEAAKKDKTSRSRSRGNRKSFFGGLLDKKEKSEETKDLKKEEKKEEKAEKKEEAAHKKEEAKATHDSSKATEAAEAAAVAAVPAAGIAAEKKTKRGSVFGGIFGKKNATATDAEKAEAEAGPAVPTKDSDIPPVSETAPKIEQPVHQAPLDTAAVVAPVDTVQTPAAVEEPVTKDKPTTPTEATSTSKQQKEAPAAATGEERPVNPQRRSSLMERFGTQKKKATKTSESDGTPTEVKREKSPLPSKVVGLFRKPSKAVKPVEEKPVETNGLTNGHSEPAAVAKDAETAPAESAIVGDVVPEDVHAATVHDQVTAAPEVKTSA